LGPIPNPQSPIPNPQSPIKTSIIYINNYINFNINSILIIKLKITKNKN